MTSPLPENEAVRRLHAQYAVARALAESTSLGEAAPRVLRAICEALGWDHGGLWRVDAAAGVLRCVGDLADARPRLPELRGGQPEALLRVGRGAARARVEEPPAGLHPRRLPRRQLPPRGGGEPRGPARRPRHAHRARRAGPRRAGVLQPRHRTARRGAPRDAGDDREPGRPVRRAQARGGGARDALRDVAGHALHRRPRRHLSPPEPGLGENARLHRGRADVPALRRVRPPGRPGRDDGRGGEHRERRGVGHLREPLPLQGRLLSLAGLEVDAHPRRGRHLRDGARRDGAAPGRGRPAPGARGGPRGEPGEGRLPREHEPRDQDADERGDRDDGAAPRHGAAGGAARVRGHPQGLGRVAPGPDQRRPRLLEDRGRALRAPPGRVRPPGGPR